MIQIEEKANIIYMIATSKLNDKDYDQMLPVLREKIKKNNKINWYFQMKELEGWTTHAFWRDVKFDLQNTNKLNRVAIVEEKKWHELMTNAMKPLTNDDILYYYASKAKEWISKSEL